jgi:hypothetical protein
MVSQDESRLELRSSDKRCILPDHLWHIVCCENICVKCVESGSNADRSGVGLPKINRDLRIVVYQQACDIFETGIAVHLKVERSGVVTVRISFLYFRGQQAHAVALLCREDLDHKSFGNCSYHNLEAVVSLALSNMSSLSHTEIVHESWLLEDCATTLLTKAQELR